MCFLEIVSAAVSGTKYKGTIDKTVWEELKSHAVFGLTAECLTKENIPQALLAEWKESILQNVIRYHQYTQVEKQFIRDIGVPIIILKGTAASQYYRHPEFRIMGDIDSIVRPDDFHLACRNLQSTGYDIHHDTGREIVFVKGKFVFEVHRSFASLHDPILSQWLDETIISNIKGECIYLPELLNGLVILEHIAQHMENGIGMRQIVDWMMYVNHFIDDSWWPEFQKYAQHIELDTLALVVTRMCEIHLGLRTREWTKNVDPALCGALMDYVCSNGNFGNKRKKSEDSGASIILRMRGVRSFFKLLQQRGMINWPIASKNKFLSRFAWLYQLIRYTYRAMNRDQAGRLLKEEYYSAKRRFQLFRQLGIHTKSEKM